MSELNLPKLEKTLGATLFAAIKKAFTTEEPAPIALASTNIADGSGIIKGDLIAITEVATTAAEEAEPVGMTEQAVLAAIQTSLSKQAEVFNAEIKAIKETHSAALKVSKEAFAAMAEGMEAMADLKATPPAAGTDPKNQFAQKKAENTKNLFAVINQLKTT